MAGVIDREGWVEILSDAYLDAQDYDMTVKSVAELLATRVMAAIEDEAGWDYTTAYDVGRETRYYTPWTPDRAEAEMFTSIRAERAGFPMYVARRRAEIPPGPWLAIEEGGDE